MANNIISRLRVKLGLDNSSYKAGLNESEKQTKNFSSTIGKIGTSIAAAFGVREVLRFGAEMVKLAGEAEGVERAFLRIGGDKIFDELKESTRGTVSNLELMRKAVMAQNLGVPVQELGKLFEFASQRAADTGESVDFLVNSIVTGIGRKSPLILDNLGISAIALKDKMNGVAIGTASVGDVAEAVGKIAEEELNKIGDASTTNGQKIQSFAASWDNVKLAIGQAITRSEDFGPALDIIIEKINNIGKSEGEITFDKLDKNIARAVSKGEDELTLLNTVVENSKKNLKELESVEIPEFLGLPRSFREVRELREKVEKEEDILAAANKRIREVEKQRENKALIERFSINKKTIDQLKQLESSFASFTFGKNKELADKVLPLIRSQIAEREKAAGLEMGTIKALSQELELLQSQRDVLTGDALANTNKRIAAIKAEIKELENLGLAINKIKPIDIQAIQGGLDTRALDQTIQQDEPTLPLTLTTEGTFGASEQIKQLQAAAQASADYAEKQDLIAEKNMMLQQSAAAYGSILSSVGQIAQVSGDNQIGAILNVAATTIQAVASMIPSLFSQATGSAVASGAALPFPANIAAIATGVAAVASAFSGLGGGGHGGGGAPRTSIDTRGFTSPTVNTSTTRQASHQSIDVNVIGTIKGKDIALANNQGQKDLRK